MVEFFAPTFENPVWEATNEVPHSFHTDQPMLKPRTLKILGLILAVYFLLLIPGFFWPAYLDSPAGILLLLPMLSVYLFHGLGVPGLLQNNGLCGWGWCSPTWFGWTFLLFAWVMLAWGIACGMAKLTNGTRHQE